MIKLYKAKITDFTQADYTKQYSLLEHAIREKIDVKNNIIAKQQSLAGYILLYRAIEELYPKNQISITFNQHGKPLCDFCFFNISHSDKYVVCVVADEPVGIDVQQIKGITKRKKYRFYNSKESDYVNQDANLVSKRYIEIFTKKEAAVKMLGLSISNAAKIDTFSNEFSFETHINDDFILTVCKEKVKIM